MNERLLMLGSAVLILFVTVCGVSFLVSLTFYIGFGEWVSVPFFIGVLLSFPLLGVFAYSLRKKKASTNSGH